MSATKTDSSLLENYQLRGKKPRFSGVSDRLAFLYSTVPALIPFAIWIWGNREHSLSWFIEQTLIGVSVLAVVFAVIMFVIRVRTSPEQRRFNKELRQRVRRHRAARRRGDREEAIRIANEPYDSAC
jgi:hypothetical protein